MNRRQALKVLGNSALAVGVGAALRYKVLPPGPSDSIADVDSLARQLYASLDVDDRAAACVDYDHPFSQYHNRGVPGGGVSCWIFFWNPSLSSQLSFIPGDPTLSRSSIGFELEEVSLETASRSSLLSTPI